MWIIYIKRPTSLEPAVLLVNSLEIELCKGNSEFSQLGRACFQAARPLTTSYLSHTQHEQLRILYKLFPLVAEPGNSCSIQHSVICAYIDLRNNIVIFRRPTISSQHPRKKAQCACPWGFVRVRALACSDLVICMEVICRFNLFNWFYWKNKRNTHRHNWDRIYTSIICKSWNLLNSPNCNNGNLRQVQKRRTIFPTNCSNVA